MTSSFGIDFGTSNSTVAALDAAGEPQLVALEGDHVTLPSALFFDFESDEVRCGRDAIGHYMAGTEGRLMRALKSVLGSALMKETTRIKARRYAFPEIIGLFIAQLRSRTEVALGVPCEQAVVGRPVRFVDDDDAADAEAQAQLEQAFRDQGFAHVEFQFEPIAAALDYERGVEREELVLVADLGGGTSDFSVIRVSPDRRSKIDRAADILSTGGVHIGGTDFDRLLSMASVMPELGLGTETKDGKRHLPVAPYYNLSTWHRVNQLYTAQAQRELRETAREAEAAERVALMVELVEDRRGHALIGAVEDAKIALSQAPEVAFAFPVREDLLSARMSIEAFDDALGKAVAKLTGTVADVIASAGISRDTIDAVLLTGGSTQVPTVLAGLEAALPGAKLVRTDVFGSVGQGLALEARRRFGQS
ncbi:Hsp70 family protein [Devosia pacifica]|nr:Hsp70 family protein [Devosia pacifica]